MAKIAIVEDQRDSNDRIKQLIADTSPDHEIFQAFSLDDALALIETQHFDLVVVDIDLGGPRGKYAGFTVLKRLGGKKNTVTLVVSGAPEDQVYEQVLSLEAYDFISKPLNDMGFVNTFVHALESINPTKEIEFPAAQPVFPPDLTRDPSKPLAFLWKGRRVNLSLTQSRIVDVLANNFGTSVDDSKLISQLGTSRAKTALASHITYIRKNFKDVDPNFQAIISDPGKGYIWKAGN